MKKLVLISTLVASLAGMSAFGQGWFQFQTGKSQVWDGYSTGTAHLGATVNVSFLWAANGDTPSISAIAASIPNTANIASAPGNSYTTAAAWADILSDPNFTLAVNTANSQVAVALSAANGGVAYNGGGAFGVQNTSPGAYSVYMIGWNSAYATPALAAAAGTYVGWSAPFSYTATANTIIPGNFSGVTPQFGVAGLIPEPSTIALAGLGSLGMLLFRRRK